MAKKDCNELCQLFRWTKCSTRDKSGKCDIPEMYDSDDLSFRRLEKNDKKTKNGNIYQPTATRFKM